MGSLDSVRSKIDWAYQHLKALEIELSRHFHSEPSHAVGEIDADTNTVVSMRVEPAPIPPAVPLLIGDCLQNLRSCLDYLVWEMVLASKNEPNKDNQFPICHAENTFKSQLGRGRLKGITDDEAIAEIERLQPYHCGDDWRHDPLAIFDELCNINKHRRLLLTKAEPLGVVADFSSNSGNKIQSFIPVGDQAMDIEIIPPMRDGEQMKMKGRSILAVVFDEGTVKGEEVCQCLGRLGCMISERVIPRFQRFF